MQTKHTPGEWTYDEIWSLIKGPKGEEICALHTGVTHTAQNAKRFNKAIAQANAALIAEAGTVASETGLTPRQLAEQRQELLAACKGIIGMLTQPVQFTGIRNGPSCDVLRGDCASAVVRAKGAIAKAERGAR